MGTRTIPIKMATVSERAGSVQCEDSFLRKCILNNLNGTKGVIDARRLAWDIIYFKTDEGIKARNIIEGLQLILPIFAAERSVRPPWIARSIWLLLALLYGTYNLLDMVDHYLDGGIIIWNWLAGVVTVTFSFWNYDADQEFYAWIGERARMECAQQLKDHWENKR